MSRTKTLSRLSDCFIKIRCRINFSVNKSDVTFQPEPSIFLITINSDIELKKLDSLQCIRALAALAVVAFHLNISYKVTSGNNLPGAEWGFLGVDVFFVLSGFVVAYSTKQMEGLKFSISFLARRVGRVYLGYWPFLLLGIWFAIHFNPEKLTQHNLITSFFLTEPSMHGLIVGIAWSLVYELFFYVIYTCALWIKKEHRLIALVFIAIFVLSWNSYWQISHPGLVENGDMPGNFFFSGLMLEFLVGCVLAYACDFFLRLSSKKLWAAYLAAVFIAIALIVAAIAEPKIRNIELFRALYFGGFASVLIMCAVTSELVFAIRYPKWLVLLGDASFTIYLFHGFAIDVSLSGGIRAFLIGHQNWVNIYWALFVTAVLIISTFYYKSIEHPLYKAFTKSLRTIATFRRSQPA